MGRYIEASHDIEVPFFDVDSLHVAWHGHYCKYFELARCTLLDRIGYNYKDMADSGYSFPVVDLRIKYVKPLRFLQKVTVVARLVEWEYRLRIDYLIVDQDGTRLTSGHTIQAAVRLDTAELTLQCPQQLAMRVQACLDTLPDPVSDT